MVDLIFKLENIILHFLISKPPHSRIDKTIRLNLTVLKFGFFLSSLTFIPDDTFKSLASNPQSAPIDEYQQASYLPANLGRFQSDSDVSYNKVLICMVPSFNIFHGSQLAHTILQIGEVPVLDTQHPAESMGHASEVSSRPRKYISQVTKLCYMLLAQATHTAHKILNIL